MAVEAVVELCAVSDPFQGMDDQEGLDPGTRNNRGGACDALDIVNAVHKLCIRRPPENCTPHCRADTFVPVVRSFQQPPRGEGPTDRRSCRRWLRRKVTPGLVRGHPAARPVVCQPCDHLTEGPDGQEDLTRNTRPVAVMEHDRRSGQGWVRQERGSPSRWSPLHVPKCVVYNDVGDRDHKRSWISAPLSIHTGAKSPDTFGSTRSLRE